MFSRSPTPEFYAHYFFSMLGLGLGDKHLPSDSDCNSNFQSLQMFVRDITPVTTCTIIFFLMRCNLVFDRSNFSEEKLWGFGHFQDHQFFTEESIAFTAALSPFPLTETRSIKKSRRQQTIMQKCRPRLNWITRKFFLHRGVQPPFCLLKIVTGKFFFPLTKNL